MTPKGDEVTTTPAASAPPPAEVDRLMTGAEYLESLRDAREVYIYGERVPDVTTHPAFRNAARSITRLYDTLHDPAQRDLLTKVDERGIRTHKFFAPSQSAEELRDPTRRLPRKDPQRQQNRHDDQRQDEVACRDDCIEKA